MGDLTIIIGVFICGLVAMFVELFLPGAIIGTIGFLAVAGSIVFAFVRGHSTTGAVLVMCTIAFIPVFFTVWKNVLARYFAITGDEKDFRPSALGSDLVGAEGITLSALRPSGIARLNEQRYDVVTRGEMLEKGTRIRVIEVSGNRIVVARA